MYEWARNPYVLLITIYIFAPYFTTTVVGDPVRGQAIWGDIASTGGFIIAVLAPFLGAVADAGGRRKPWIAFYTAIMIAGTLLLWNAMPGSTRLADLRHRRAGRDLQRLLRVLGGVPQFDAADDRPAQARRAACRGWGWRWAMPRGSFCCCSCCWRLRCRARCIGASSRPIPCSAIDQALHEPERLAGPMEAVWLLVFAMPLFFFTPDRASLRVGLWQAMVMGVRRCIRTVRSLKHYKNVAHYLGARADLQ